MPIPTKRTPKKKEDAPDVEVSSPLFNIKLDDISYKTIIIVAMILIAIVVTVQGY
jgi:hypothetical protein